MKKIAYAAFASAAALALQAAAALKPPAKKLPPKAWKCRLKKRWTRLTKQPPLRLKKPPTKLAAEGEAAPLQKAKLRKAKKPCNSSRGLRRSSTSGRPPIALSARMAGPPTGRVFICMRTAEAASGLASGEATGLDLAEHRCQDSYG
ncbi:MAG: hypothetical protein H6917_13205 [Novosphingobium sp.]|nr:hypothetical protein [Novosphingobium sp.]